MESIISIDLKNNPDILDDFEGMTPGEKVKVVAECTISELSERRASLPLDSIVSVTSMGGGEEEDEEPATEVDEES